MRNAHKEAIAAGISCISESLMQIYWMAWPRSPSGGAPEERPDNDALVFFIMKILPYQLIPSPSELSSPRHKLS